MRFQLIDTRTGEIKHQAHKVWSVKARTPLRQARRPKQVLDTDALLVVATVAAGLLAAATLIANL